VNSNLELDLHPDADSLNAFAEQALGVAEREQILAHMTRCSRCRQVIYLAQKAAEAEALEAPSAMPSGRWYRSWRIAWVPAAALAAALTLLVTIHSRQTALEPEIAKVVPQSAQAPPVPAPVPQVQPSAGAALKPAPAVAANSAAGSGQFAALRRPPKELALETAPSAAFPAAPGTGARTTEENNAAPSPSMGTSQMRTQQQSPAQFNPEPAVDAWQQRQRMTGALSASANTTQASQESMKAAMDRAPADRSVPAFAAVSHTPKQAAPATSFDIGTQKTIVGSAASRDANLPKLPSGLAAVSTATARQRTLAIDLAGALFLSEDAGKHWEPVARQWTGHAITVRVQTGVSGAVFQLTNISGSTWVSADGKIWTAQ
jgi:hypothetical protein